MDLGAWGNESFRVPAETPPQDMPMSDPRLDELMRLADDLLAASSLPAGICSKKHHYRPSTKH